MPIAWAVFVGNPLLWTVGKYVLLVVPVLLLWTVGEDVLLDNLFLIFLLTVGEHGIAG